MGRGGRRGMAGAAELQLGRAVLLIVAALIVGVVLLHRQTGTPTTLAATGATTTTVKRSVPRGATGAVTSTTAALRNPQDIKVLVANGTDTRGAASSFSDRLHKAGYDTLASTNASTPAASSTVFYAPGLDREATVVANLLGLQPSAVQPLPQQAPVAQLHDADLLVVVGPDLAGQSGGSASPSTTSAPSTTVRHTATTTVTTTTRAATTTTSRG
jgi:hypothetical protein